MTAPGRAATVAADGMLSSEPGPTALALLVAAALLATSALLSRASSRLGFPFGLVFLVIGMLAGSEGVGGIVFDDYGLAFRLGTVALVLILFDGGLNTSLGSIRAVAWPAGILATAGVAGVAAVAAVGARLAGFPWAPALVLGAVVSSTDAAAVFAVLRGAGLRLKQRVAATLEVESGLNDPMAVILTFALTASLVGGGVRAWALAGQVVVQIAVGTAAGVALGAGARLLLQRVRVAAAGIYPVLTISLAMLAFAVPTLFGGSGFLAVYVAGAVLGDGRIPYRNGVRHVHDALAWTSQITMFLVLGLLVFPSRLASVAWQGLALALFLAFVARPVVIAAVLLLFRYPLREIVYVAWIGLRGAVPIILATYPVLSRAPGAERIFDVVFFVVVVNALVPGWTVRWLARRLGLEAEAPPPPPAAVEITSTEPINGEIVGFHVDPASAVAGSRSSELPFPEGTSVLLLVRGGHLVAPRGSTVLVPGDHVYLFCESSERELAQLIFGRGEGE